MTGTTFQSAIDNVTQFETIRETVGSPIRIRRLRQALDERTYVGGTTDYMVALRIGGSEAVTRYEGNRIDGRGASIGGVCISGAEHEHGWLFPEKIDVVHLYLDRKRLERSIEHELDADGRSLVIEPVWSAADAFLHQFILAADEALDDATPADRLFLDQMEATLSAHILRRYSNFGRPLSTYERIYSGEDARIARVIAFVEESFAQTLRISDLAEVAAMSTSNLMRSFKAQTGLSVAAYVRERRLQRAREMLSEPRRSLSQVAFDTGFSDHSHLTRSFKARFGVTPSQWRR